MKNDKIYDVAIIGGGASGLLLAAILCKRGKSVVLLEKNQRVGKKLLATGNGRCNLLNIYAKPNIYNESPFVKRVFEEYSTPKVLEVFSNLGLETYVDECGRVYPYSDSAATVLNLLRDQIDGSVQQLLGCDVKHVVALKGGRSVSGVDCSDTGGRSVSGVDCSDTGGRSVSGVDCSDTGGRVVSGVDCRSDTDGKVAGVAEIRCGVNGRIANSMNCDSDCGAGFEIEYCEAVFDDDGRPLRGGNCISKALLCDNVVLASGSPAGFGTDSCGLYAELGHRVIPFLPSLVPLKTDRRFLKGLSGVRSKAEIRLINGEDKCNYEDKDIRFEKLGATAGRDESVVYCEVGEVLFKDFGVSGIAVFNASCELARHRSFNGYLSIDFAPDYTQDEVNKIVDEGRLDCLLKPKIAEAIERRAEEQFGNKTNSATLVKHYTLGGLSLGDMSLAQVCSGGLCAEDFDASTLESRIVKGCYAVGETLNVDGRCGGYNLAFAFASALTVADGLSR